MRTLYIWLAIALLSLTGCVKENISTCDNLGPGSDVRFALQVTGQSKQSLDLDDTRAINILSEKTINRVDIIAFKVESGNELFAYHVKAKFILDTGTPDIKDIIATLVLSNKDTKYRFVLLANLPDSEGEALSGFSRGTPKNYVLGSIIINNPEAWKTDNDTPGNFTPFPMWGESDLIVVNNEVVIGGINGIRLARSVAKFDIALTTQTVMDDFKMEEVHFYNRNTRGNVVPAPENWNISEAIAATIPPDNDPQNPLTVKGPLVYSVTDNVSLANTIYTFETAAPAQSSYSEATCVVIGGKYKNDSKATYYRIDFRKPNDSGFKDILRNHYYKINIRSILGSGYDSSEEAFNSIPANIVVDIKEWDMNKIINSASDGQFILNVSQDLFEITKDPRSEADFDNKLTAYTDYPEGWRINTITDENNSPISWLSVGTTEQNGQAMEEKTISILAQYNNSNSTRTGIITLTAGRINYQITVRQNDMDVLDISIKDTEQNDVSEYHFSANPGQAQSSIPAKSFTVHWKPFIGGNPCNYSTSTIGDKPFDYGDGLVIPNTGTLANTVGAMEYINIQPKPFTLAEVAENGTGNPFLEKISRIDFVVSNGVHSKSKSIILNQTNYAVVANTAPFYLMNGAQSSFILKSNSGWKITLQSDPDGVIESFTASSGGYDTQVGQRIDLTLKNKAGDLSIIESNVTFLVECTDPNRYFPPKIIMLECFNAIEVPASNTYMIKPGGAALLIPIIQYQKTFTMKDGVLPNDWVKPNDVFDAKLLWTDNSNHVGSNSTIRAYRGVGKGTMGYLFVAPGSMEGNAVVALAANDEIKWSWHIWVTNYDPGSGESAGPLAGKYTVDGGHVFRYINAESPAINSVMMDRNLGAISAVEGSASAQGLFYQWGRKDPFIGKGNWSDDATEPDIYDEFLAFAMRKLRWDSTGMSDNVPYSINHPDVFLYSANDWTMRSDNLWWKFGDVSNTYKTAFDPCPLGWVVPTTKTYYSLNLAAGNAFEVAPGTNGLKAVGPYAFIGFLPMTGLRGADGKLQGVGSESATWTYQPSGQNSLAFIYTYTALDPGKLISRAQGSSVRCVKNYGAE